MLYSKLVYSPIAQYLLEKCIQIQETQIHTQTYDKYKNVFLESWRSIIALRFVLIIILCTHTNTYVYIPHINTGISRIISGSS